jgi:peptidylprolyl isomerase
MNSNVSDLIYSVKAGLMFFVMAAVVLASGCGRDDVVKEGSRVKIIYEGSLADGSVFDKSEESQPLEFTAGRGEMIPGFDKAVLGMKLNEKKEFTIPPEEAYGLRNDTWVRKVPPSFFPADMTPQINMMLSLQDERGRSFPGTITEITEDSITIDLNNPLAGKELTFKIEIVGIEQAE